MRIGLIGGLERAGPLYDRLAASSGHDVLFHDGEMGGRGARALEHLVDRCDLVVIVTDVNSHGAAQLARRRLRERGRSPLLLRRCGLARFGTLLAALNAGSERVAAPGAFGDSTGFDASRVRPRPSSPDRTEHASEARHRHHPPSRISVDFRPLC